MIFQDYNQELSTFNEDEDYDKPPVYVTGESWNRASEEPIEIQLATTLDEEGRAEEELFRPA